MNKRMVWLIAALAMLEAGAQAKVVIRSPTGLPDESDVALESAVQAVKKTPADVAEVVEDAVSYVGDELRNTARGVAAVFQGDSPQENAREDLLEEVAGAWDAPDQITLRSYKISSAVVGEMAPSGHANGSVLDVSSFFSSVNFPEGSGAYLWPDSQRLMARNTRQNLLEIETALSQYHQAEKDYKQVEIKAKFIEVSQSALNQLGFTWSIQDVGGTTTGARLGDRWQVNDNQGVFSAGLRTAAGAFGGTPGAGSMVLTKTGWMPLSLAIHALEQASDSDVLSAPSLTTLNGKAAEIWVGEDRKVPKGFEVKSTDINIHIEHTDWDSELMGVHFSVTPDIENDELIRLQLNPKIIDLIGYDSYKVSPTASMFSINGAEPMYQMVEGQYPIMKYVPGTQTISDLYNQMSAAIAGLYGGVTDINDPLIRSYVNQDDAGNSVPYYGYMNERRRMDYDTFGFPLNPVSGQLPYFRVREINTQVVVADGSTVGLGGLIYDRLETYKDKTPILGSIPLIGRLFRSEGERSIKRNLMIFVSATQVDNNGQRKSDIVLNK